MFIRYWSWTNSTDVPPEPPVVIGGGGAFRPDKVLSEEDMLRIRIRNDDDLLLFVVAAWTTIRE